MDVQGLKEDSLFDCVTLDYIEEWHTTNTLSPILVKYELCQYYEVQLKQISTNWIHNTNRRYYLTFTN